MGGSALEIDHEEWAKGCQLIGVYFPEWWYGVGKKSSQPFRM